MINSDKTAVLHHNVTDQGNGSGYCSLCGERQTDYFEKRLSNYKAVRDKEREGAALTAEELSAMWRNTNRCENCGAFFTSETTYVNFGGSDF